MSAQTLPELPAYSLAISKINLRMAGGWYLLLSLEPASAAAGVDHLSGWAGWPRWELSGFLKADSPWVAVFDGKRRALQLVARPAVGGRGSVDALLDCGEGIPLPPALWELVGQQQRVVLCGPVHGDPTGTNLRAAEQAGELCAIAAPVMLT